jgi:hypothetical protein
MKTYFVTFRSITFAQRGERVLQKAGISCLLQRTPRWMEAQGCGYSLRLSMQEMPKAIAMLRQQRVPMRKIYLQMEDGEVQEVQL